MTAETIIDRGRRGRRVANGALHELRHSTKAPSLRDNAVRGIFPVIFLPLLLLLLLLLLVPLYY